MSAIFNTEQFNKDAAALIQAAKASEELFNTHDIAQEEAEKAAARMGSFDDFIRRRFEPQDNICFTLISPDKSVKIENIFKRVSQLTPEFVQYLHQQNDSYNVYVGMNAYNPALSGESLGRTKENVVAIRNLYADADDNGAVALQEIIGSACVPQDPDILESSPGKYQFMWRVEDMPKDEAEGVLKAIAGKFGTDTAVTEVARVLRVPGFKNLKYPAQPVVKSVQESNERFARTDFKLETVREDKIRVDASEDGPRIPYGSHDTELTRIAGVLRSAGMNVGKIEEHLIDVCEKRCEGYGEDYRSMCRKIARSIGSKPVTVPGTLLFNGVVQDQSSIVGAAPSEPQPYDFNGSVSWIERYVPKGYQLSSKEPEWLIEEMIYRTGLHLFSGHKGSMKSMLTAIIAEKVCKGESFLHRKNIGRPITVVYIDRENPETEIRRRVHALGLAQCENFFAWGDWGTDNPPPATFDDLRLLEQVKLRPDTLFVFDSLSSFLGGRDENSTGEMMEVMSKARSLARLCAGVILIHHSAKNGTVQARGNTAIGASTDMAFIVEKQGNKVEVSEERFRFCAGYTMKFEMDFGGASGKYSYKLIEQVGGTDLKDKAEVAVQAEADKLLTDQAFAVVFNQYNLGVPISKRQLATAVGITSSATRERVLTGGPDKPWRCVVGYRNSTVFIPQGAMWPLPKKKID